MTETSSNDRTYMALLLDRSGSMGMIKHDMEPAMNRFIDEQRDVPGKCKVTFAQFDDSYDVLHRSVKIKDIPKLTLEPRGMTALLDAMGKMLTEARADVAALPADKHPKYKIIVVVTDGGENSSKEWTKDRVFDLVRKMEAEGWKFTYVGANQDAIAVGTSMGFSHDSSMTYTGSTAGITNTFSAMSNSVGAVRRAKAVSVNYSSSDRLGAMEDDDIKS